VDFVFTSKEEPPIWRVMVKLFLYSFVLIFGVCTAKTIPLQVQEQVADIDDQILELQEMKRGFEARALRHEDQAERLQFDPKWNLETRRHLQLADENRQKAARVQKEIDRLKAKRAKLLQ